MGDFAKRGSQRWLQILVQRRPDLLAGELRGALGLPRDTTIEWRAPLAADEFCEYRDSAALRKVGITSLPNRALKDFWPVRGPVWDALAVASGQQPIFVEAKAHIREAASGATAASEESRRKIEASLAEARHYYAPRAKASWSGTFYQYGNRLAHHYFLRVVNKLPSHLVFLYFLNDEEMKGPATRAEWHGAVQLLHAALGLRRDLSSEGIHDVFVDVRSLSVGGSSEPAHQKGSNGDAGC